MRAPLPPVICCRVTGRCNARCGFCLAPEDETTADAATLGRRLEWLMAHGVKGVQFCGGEPTLHPSLPELLLQAHARGAKVRLTTNAIDVPPAVLSALRATTAQVKVSLHGDRAWHDTLVGCAAFDRSVANLRRLVAAGVATSVQTTMVAGGAWVLEWMVDFCRDNGIRRLSLLPFLPRGKGRARRAQFGLSQFQHSALRDQVKQKRRALAASLDLRWLDFSAGTLPVLELDGRVVLEGATEARDQLLCRIP